MSEMLNNVNTNIERIIAKIDNDFNPDNSDWIPRVGAWCIDAMSQLDVLRTKRKRKKLTVVNRIAYSDCPITSTNIKIYDKSGCRIKEAIDKQCCNDDSSTGSVASATSDRIVSKTPSSIDIIDTKRDNSANYVVAETNNDKYPFRYNIHHYSIKNNNEEEHNYVIVDDNKIEINFDTDFIFVETEYIETDYSNLFGCELPVIPNNGLLIEAIAYFCIYKMLCRGYKHPVFNLNASQYGTNPYYIWLQLKEEAKRSVINNSINFDNASKLFRSNLFIEMFDSRE